MDQQMMISTGSAQSRRENLLPVRDLKKSGALFRSLPNDILLAEVKSLVRKERAIQAEFLEALREVAERKLYLTIGFESLFEFMTKGLGYQGGSAQRRIDAVRLSQAVPEVIAKVKEGSLNLMTVSRLQSVIKTEERTKREKLGAEVKKELVKEITNKTLRETDQVLFQKLPDASLKAASLRKESVKSVSADQSRMTLLISNQLRGKLERMREVISNKNLEPGLESVLESAVDEYLKRHDPLRKAERALSKKIAEKRNRKFVQSRRSSKKMSDVSEKVTSKGEVTLENFKARGASIVEVEKSKKEERVAIPARTKNLVFLRDKARCQAKDIKTGRICGSRKYIELDHVIPVAKGGSNDVGNLRCACRAHNQYFAEQAFGKEWMARFT